MEQITFKDFVNLKELEILFEEFSCATGFTVGIIDQITHEVLISIGRRDICMKFHRTYPDSKKNCTSCVKEISAGFKQIGEIHIQHCQNGLINGYSPVIVQGEHFANICTGQILFGPPDIEQFRKRAEKYGYDEQEYLKNLAEVPIVSKERFSAMLRYLAHTASIIAEAGFARLDITERKKREEELRKNKREWERTFDAMPDIVTIQDKNLTIIRANQAASRVLGMSLDDIVGYHCYALFHGSDKSCRDCPLVVTGENFLPYSREMYHEKLKKTFQVSAAPLFDAQGELEYIIHVAKDISALKRSEEGRLRLAAAIDQASEIVMISDPEGYIQYVNPVFEKTTGFTCKEAIGQHSCFLSHEKQDAVSYEKMWTILHQGETWSGSLLNIKKDGTSFEEEATISPVKDRYGQITNFVAVKRDVSREKSLEKQLRQAVKMEAIGTLAGGIAHDFNNILAAILGYSEMARAQLPADDLIGRDLDKVIQSGHRATDLVKQILTFSRQEEGVLKPFNVHIIVEEVLKLLRSSLPTTIELTESVATNCGPILADSTQFHQVLMNLCTNARQAIGQNAGMILISLSEIEITAADTPLNCPQIAYGTYLDLEVSDSGPGMDEVTQSKIFDPFFTTKETGKGTGLGLAVVHGIVKQHKGEITVSSEPGMGTTFHVYLPVLGEESAERAAVETEDIPGGNERILIVDDEKMLGRLMQRMLNSLGYTVTSFSSSFEALNVYTDNSGDFDLVITDMTMPEMTGIELTSKLLALQPDLPVILCTGFSEAINEATAKSFGIREYVMKPVDILVLAKAIRKALKPSLKID